MLTSRGMFYFQDDRQDAFGGDSLTQTIGLTICALEHECGGMAAVSLFIRCIASQLLEDRESFPGLAECLQQQLSDHLPAILNEGASRGFKDIFLRAAAELPQATQRWQFPGETLDGNPGRPEHFELSLLGGLIIWIMEMSPHPYYTRSSLAARNAAYLKVIGYPIGPICVWDGKGLPPEPRPRGVVLVVGGSFDTDMARTPSVRVPIIDADAMLKFYYREETIGSMLLNALGVKMPLLPESLQEMFMKVQICIKDTISLSWNTRARDLKRYRPDGDIADRDCMTLYSVCEAKRSNRKSSALASRLASVYFPTSAELFAPCYYWVATEHMLVSVQEEKLSELDLVPSVDLAWFRVTTAMIVYCVAGSLAQKGFECLPHAVRMSLRSADWLESVTARIDRTIRNGMPFYDAAILVGIIHAAASTELLELETAQRSMVLGVRNGCNAVIPALLSSMTPTADGVGIACFAKFIGNLSVYPDGSIRGDDATSTDWSPPETRPPDTSWQTVRKPMHGSPDIPLYLGIERAHQGNAPSTILCARIKGSVTGTVSIRRTMCNIVRSLKASADCRGCHESKGVINVSSSQWIVLGQERWERLSSPLTKEHHLFMPALGDSSWALFIAGSALDWQVVISSPSIEEGAVIPEESSESHSGQKSTDIWLALSRNEPDSTNRSSVNVRSEIRLQDEKTKFGTIINGQRVASGAITLLDATSDLHTFQLGTTEHIFRIKWQPVVLTVSLGSKEIKAGKDPLASLRSRLAETDVKAVSSYIIDKTSHVVQSKRNTAKGLQALINGKYIVTENFVDAVVYATAPTDFDHDESLSPLEEDFNKHWPDAMQYVPPRGKEPNERPVAAFAPRPERANVFEGYSFVFCDKAQFESLQAPITNGGGKAFHFVLTSKQTSTEELVRYVKSLAGEKGLGELEDGSEGRGVVVVKFRGGKDDFDWAAQLGREASLALDLRFIEQNEFMDAILMNDASTLRRPLEVAEDDGDSNPPIHHEISNGTASAVQESQQEASQPEESQPLPAPPRRQRGLIKSRFKGFDEDDEDDDKPALASIPMEEPQRQLQPQSEPAQQPSTQPTNPRKRPASAASLDDDDFVDQLLPAAAAIKRRRLEEVEAARLRGEPSPPTSFTTNPNPAPPTATASKTSKPTPAIDIKKSLRERRAAADLAATAQQESLDHDLADGANVAAMRNLAVVEEFDVASQQNRNSRSHHSNNGSGNADANDRRWNPAWNGRKNFKKFRRQGEGGNMGPRRGIMQHVIVPLEEVKKRGAGVGEEYWLESSEKLKRKRKEKERERVSQSQVVVGGSSGSQGRGVGGRDGGSGGRDSRDGEMAAPRTVVKVDEEDEDDTMMMGDVPAEPTTTTRRTGGRSQASAPPTVTKSTTGSAKQNQTRQQQRLEVADDSESEDELKFRFGKRRRV
ncbi:MAG: hypothetical protein Q9220_006524 [cf. Caloplaca sp. 1 TL-2023]